MNIFAMASDTILSQLGTTIQTPAGEMTAIVTSKHDATRLRHKSELSGLEMDAINASLQVSATDGALLSQGATVTVAEDDLNGNFDISKIEPIGGGLVKLHLTEHQTGSADEDIWR
jgi:hypothetical protein